MGVQVREVVLLGGVGGCGRRLVSPAPLGLCPWWPRLLLRGRAVVGAFLAGIVLRWSQGLRKRGWEPGHGNRACATSRQLIGEGPVRAAGFWGQRIKGMPSEGRLKELRLGGLLA